MQQKRGIYNDYTHKRTIEIYDTYVRVQEENKAYMKRIKDNRELYEFMFENKLE